MKRFTLYSRVVLFIVLIILSLAIIFKLVEIGESFALNPSSSPSAPTPSPTSDPGYCGVGVFETREWDPYWTTKTCKNHDNAFNALSEGKRNDNGFAVTGKFFRDATSTMLKSVYGVTAYVPYLLLGGLGGLARWTYIKYKNKK